MSLHERKTGGEGIFFYQGIGVEQQYILSPRQPDGLVIGPGKTRILCVRNEQDFRKFFAQHLQGIVHGVIVHHKDFYLQVACSSAHCIQGLLQKVADVVIDNDHRQIQARLPCFHLFFQGFVRRPRRNGTP